MKKLIFAIFCLFAFNSTTFALVEVDITRGNLNPLPVAVSSLTSSENDRKSLKNKLYPF